MVAKQFLSREGLDEYFAKSKSYFAKKSELESHEENGDIHTTADEKAKWNDMEMEAISNIELEAMLK